MSFRDRSQAGHQLGQMVKKYDLVDPIVVAVTPAGMLVAQEVAQALGAALRAEGLAQPWNDLRGRVVLLVDDCVCTGATVGALVRDLRALRPASIVVAVPALPNEQLTQLRAEVDEVICLFAPAGRMPADGYYDEALSTASL